MKRRIYIIETDLTNKKRIIHILRDMSYRESISHSAFFSYKKTRYQKDGRKHFFQHTFKDDLKLQLESQKRFSKLMSEDYLGFTFNVCDNLYDFYEQVGYDRKTKSFKPHQ